MKHPKALGFRATLIYEPSEFRSFVIMMIYQGYWKNGEIRHSFKDCLRCYKCYTGDEEHLLQRLVKNVKNVTVNCRRTYDKVEIEPLLVRLGFCRIYSTLLIFLSEPH